MRGGGATHVVDAKLEEALDAVGLQPREDARVAEREVRVERGSADWTGPQREVAPPPGDRSLRLLTSSAKRPRSLSWILPLVSICLPCPLCVVRNGDLLC